MIDFSKSDTLHNLIDAFCRDAQTLARYHLFARTAEFEGLERMAELFEKMAQNQALYVEGYLELLRNVHDPLTGMEFGLTRENLASAIAGEQEEVTHLYSDFAFRAEAEGFVRIASWFRTVSRSKKANIGRFEAGLSAEV